MCMYKIEKLVQWSLYLRRMTRQKTILCEYITQWYTTFLASSETETFTVGIFLRPFEC